MQPMPKWRGWSVRGARLLLLLLALIAAPALAQVPQHGTVTGRLVDAAGTALLGPVDLEFRLFDAETAGTEIYAELHSGVPLDASGGFAVQFGLGTFLRTTLPIPFESADLFGDPSRWLEVVVGVEVLTPRVVVGSVAWALIAQQANKIVADPNGAFEDCGDGTVWDPKTGLQWEKKTGTPGGGVICGTAGCPDPHDVNNRYRWSNTGVVPNGGAFTDFLEKLNDPTFGSWSGSGSDPTGCFAGHCDWRLPTISELQTIQDSSFGSPCIDPIFGPTVSLLYWSASKDAGLPNDPWYAHFDSGGVVGNIFDMFDGYVRAVRAGSCN